MVRAFSALVTSPDWQRDVLAWLTDAVAAAGVRVEGSLQTVRVRPWSAQFTVASDAGQLWLKVNAPALSFEPELHQLLAELCPGLVDHPLAIEPERGWLITRDRGATLGERDSTDAGDWRDVLLAAAQLQQAGSGHRERFLATGLPDCSPETVLGRFDRLREVMAALPPEHPSYLPPDRAADVAAVRPRVAGAADVLASRPELVTLQHGDLHPRNVLTADGQLRLFDFGDAQWAHAFEVLRVPHAWVTDRQGLQWRPLLDAYLDVWHLTAMEVAELLDAAMVCHPVNRAFTWWTCLQRASATELTEWGQWPTYHLYGVTGV